jgi:hypothetical protein
MLTLPYIVKERETEDCGKSSESSKEKTKKKIKEKRMFVRAGRHWFWLKQFNEGNPENPVGET